MNALLDSGLNEILHSQEFVISVFVLSIYSLILNITSKSSKTLTLRDFWILGCVLFNLISHIAIKLFYKTAPEKFIVLNYILLTIIPLIIILIFLDMSQATGIRSLVCNRIYVLLCFVPLIFIYFPGTFSFNGSNYILAKGYTAYAITCSILSIMPLIYFIIRLFKNDKHQRPDILLWLFAICYLFLMVSTIVDSIDYPIAQGKSPRAVIAIVLLSAFGVTSNVIRYKQIIRSMEYYEIYDELTDTFKRKAGMELLEKRIETAVFSKTPFTVILLDINNFKQLNDYYGYNTGNICLSYMARQIKRFLSPQDLICRTEGDEFLIVTNGKHSLESKLVKNLINNIDAVWKHENHLLYLKYRIGISIFPDHGKTISELMKSADEALVEAKKINAPQVILYNEHLAERKRAFEKITIQLKETLSGKTASSKFVLHYQPKVDRHGIVKSAECLLRWFYEDKLYYPGAFIEIAEKTGLIYEIGDIVLETGCKELARITQKNPTISIALNISPQQLNSPKLFESIQDKITKYSICPEQLELEITESTIIDSWNSSEVESFIKQARSAGIKVSIDDFGTGLSSLSRLLEMPADILKIDRSFVLNLPEDKKSQHMCKSITSLAHDLGMRVVAEGVERTSQAAFLYSIDCDYIQGFCFYKPMPFDDFVTLLTNH